MKETTDEEQKKVEIDRRSLLTKFAVAAAAGGILVNSKAEANTVFGATKYSSTPINLPSMPDVWKDVVKAQFDFALPDVNTNPSSETKTASKIIRQSAERYSKHFRSAGTTTAQQKSGEVAYSNDGIEKGFVYANLPDDSHFRPFFVERLLDQAADILARSVKDRTDYEDLASRALDIWLQLEEFKLLDVIHTKEIQNGLFDLDLLDSAAQQAIAQVSASQSQEALSGIIALLNDLLNEGNAKRRAGLAAAESILSGLPETPELGNGHLIGPGGIAEYAISDTRSDGYMGVSGEATGNRGIASGERSYFTDLLSRVQHFAELHSTTSEAYSQDVRKKLATFHAHWDSLNKGFRLERVEVNRRINAIRAENYVEEDGAYNFPARMNTLRRRFHLDYRDVLARLTPAKAGLANIFGYDMEVSLESSKFDDILLSVRSAISWLIRFSQSDQQFVVPISLRRMYDKKSWEKNLSTGIFSFEIGKDSAVFPIDLSYVRLRAMEMFVERKNESGFWTSRISIPKKSYAIHGFGSNRRMVNMDQDINSLRFQRIASRKDVREPDMHGNGYITNCSPFGEWSLEMNTISSSGEALKRGTDDIQVHLHIVAQTG